MTRDGGAADEIAAIQQQLEALDRERNRLISRLDQL